MAYRQISWTPKPWDWVWIVHIGVKLDIRHDSFPVKTALELQSDQTYLNPNVAALRFRNICWWDILLLGDKSWANGWALAAEYLEMKMGVSTGSFCIILFSDNASRRIIIHCKGCICFHTPFSGSIAFIWTAVFVTISIASLHHLNTIQ